MPQQPNTSSSDFAASKFSAPAKTGQSVAEQVFTAAVSSETKLESISLSQILIRLLTGFGAGLAGTIVAGIIILLSWSVVGSALAPAAQTLAEDAAATGGNASTHPLFLVFAILAIFLGSLAGCITYILLFTTVFENKYGNRATALTQVFSGNLVILVLMLLVYVVANNVLGTPGVAFAGLAHMVLAMVFSFFILEILNQSKYLMVNVYGIIIGLVIFSFFTILLGGKSTTSLAFLAMPFLIGFIAMGNGIAESLYAWIYKTYGTDFLNIETRLGTDYGVKDEVSAQEYDV